MAWTELRDLPLRAGIATFGQTVTYTRLGVSSEISGVFDAAGAVVSMDGGSIEGYAPFLGVRLVDLPDDRAQQGDSWTVDGVTYLVIAVDEDGHGGARLRGERVES